MAAARRTKAAKVHAGSRMDEDGSRMDEDNMSQKEDSIERQRTVFQWIFQYCLRHGLEATSQGGRKFTFGSFQLHSRKDIAFRLL